MRTKMAKLKATDGFEIDCDSLRGHAVQISRDQKFIRLLSVIT